MEMGGKTCMISVAWNGMSRLEVGGLIQSIAPEFIDLVLWEEDAEASCSYSYCVEASKDLF